MADHHWRNLEKYLDGVRRVVNDHAFVVDFVLDMPPVLSPGAGDISGDVFCYEDIVVDVTMNYEIRTMRNRRKARTVGYSYNARHEDGSAILRYDNAHQHAGHSTPHHKHYYRSGTEEITHTGRWPSLLVVLNELMAMAWDGR